MSNPTFFERLKVAFGPILGGMIIDVTDLATFGPVGIYAGMIIGGVVGYWVATLYRVSQQQRLLIALLAGIYCTMPGTSVFPLATLLGAGIRFLNPPQEAERKKDAIDVAGELKDEGLESTKGEGRSSR